MFGLFGAGCSGDSNNRRDAEVVAEIAGLPLDRRVVEAIAADEQLDEAEARARALDQLRYVAARRAELDARETPPEHPDDLDPTRRQQLERAALVRLWLAQEFEPDHDADDLPQRLVAQNLADPSLTRRLFHPELWFICQVLVVPPPGEDGSRGSPPDPAEDPEASARWLADANLVFAPIVARLEAVSPGILGEDDCEVIGRIAGASEREFETPSGPMMLRFERFAFETHTERLDPTWLAAVTRKPEPGLVGPFPTQFGLHLVIVDTIKASALADGSQPPAELAAAREAKLRAELVVPWRADQLQRLLLAARDRRVVRLATELE